MPESVFPEISAAETDRSNNGRGFKGPGGEHSRTMESKSGPSELLRSLYPRARGRLQM